MSNFSVRMGNYFPFLYYKDTKIVADVQILSVKNDSRGC